MAIKPSSPIVIIRKQVPLKHAYVISANKSQGQTLAKVLFDARHLAFGQALQSFSALMRATSTFGRPFRVFPLGCAPPPLLPLGSTIQSSCVFLMK